MLFYVENRRARYLIQFSISDNSPSKVSHVNSFHDALLLRSCDVVRSLNALYVPASDYIQPVSSLLSIIV